MLRRGGLIERIDYYFAEPGPENTDLVVEAVKRRLAETGIGTVVVASDSGRTAARFCEALSGSSKVIAISWTEMEAENVEKLRAHGAVIVEKSHTPLSTKEAVGIRNAYYTLGQGFKVAVEVVLIAADKGLVDVGESVIAVGGTGSGADTAIVVKASTTNDMLGPDLGRRLEVMEIIAMPMKKKWWE